MFRLLPSRVLPHFQAIPCFSALALLLSFACVAPAQTSNPANTPVSIPAGLNLPLPPQPKAAASPSATLSSKQAREADDAYLEGAKHVEHKDLAAAERSFTRAVQLNPNNRDYALALIVTRENRVTVLVQAAAKAHLLGDEARSDALLAEARAIDPDNPVVAQHFADYAAPKPSAPLNPTHLPANFLASTLAGPVELEPTEGTQNFHLRGDPQTVIRTVLGAFGITATFDNSVSAGAPIKFDFDNLDYTDATHILFQLTHVFAIPVQARSALIAKDTPDNRDSMSPQVEETIYLPGLTQDQMTELANLARNVFDLKTVTASATGGYMLIRGDEHVLQQLNAVYADMLDGGSEVLFDITLYELDKTLTRNIGATTPASAGAFDLVQSAQNLISANQSLLNQAVSSGALTLTGNTNVDEINELLVLIAAGVSGSSQFTSLLGTLGTFSGLPLLGVTIASGSTFNLLLNSSEAHTLDAVQIRSSNHTPVSFRAGSRYPIVTSTYTNSGTSSLAAQAAAAGISAALISKYLGTGGSTSTPQFQFEDLGITLKMTPQIMHSSDIQLALELKIEALGGSSLNNIPILNNRNLVSTFTVPSGKTAMLATLVSNNETKSFSGLPGLNELPGFQGTEQDRTTASTELLITITPHIVRTGSLHIASRRLAYIRAGSPAP